MNVEEGVSLPRKLTDGEKEQIKLAAAYLNGIGIGLVLVGGLSIPASIVLNVGGRGSLLGAPVLALACISMSAYIHHLAKRKLRDLDR